jgi:hypothetical protein
MLIPAQQAERGFSFSTGFVAITFIMLSCKVAGVWLLVRC